jgi:glycosyltransferase involved in cell wall biosynthesis
MPVKPVTLHYVGYNDDRGGIVAVVRALAAQQRFDCILGVNTGFKPAGTFVLPTLELPAVEGEAVNVANLFRTRTVARRVSTWLNENPARIFHGHSRAGLLVALWLKRMGHKRAIASVHCLGRQRWFYRWAARQLGNRLFWITPQMQAYYGVREDERQCVPSCSLQTAATPRPRKRNPKPTIVLGGIGSLVKWKGWHLVIDALAALPSADRAKIRFVHIGSTQKDKKSQAYADELRLNVSRSNLETSVEWCGEQSDSGPLLNEIDALVVPSENEPFSLAMIEALCAGVPVLRADSGGATSLIGAGRNGWLFRTNDASDLSRILRMLVETDALEQITIEPNSLVPFQPAVVANRWIQIYEDVLAG